jgi:hypothetical protein
MLVPAVSPETPNPTGASLVILERNADHAHQHGLLMPRVMHLACVAI